MASPRDPRARAGHPFKDDDGEDNLNLVSVRLPQMDEVISTVGLQAISLAAFLDIEPAFNNINTKARRELRLPARDEPVAHSSCSSSRINNVGGAIALVN